jgi:hypothetical protein
MYGRIFTVDPKVLARCRLCCEPMYYIYDQKLREFCYECTMQQRQQELFYSDFVQNTDGIF